MIDMNDDKFTELFKGYAPPLTDDEIFMEELQKKMDSVEMVKSYTEKLAVRSRKAAAISALVGFVTGVVATVFFFLLSPLWQSFKTDDLLKGFNVSVAISPDIIGWMLIAASALLAARKTYMAVLRANDV